MARKPKGGSQPVNRGRKTTSTTTSMSCTNKGCDAVITADTNTMLAVRYMAHLESCKFGGA